MEEILAGMHSGIGATTTKNGYTLLENPAEAILENFLYTQFIRLSLPAEIMGTLVADMNKISQSKCLYSAKLINRI